MLRDRNGKPIREDSRVRVRLPGNLRDYSGRVVRVVEERDEVHVEQFGNFKSRVSRSAWCSVQYGESGESDLHRRVRARLTGTTRKRRVG